SLSVAAVSEALPAGTVLVDFVQYSHATPSAESRGAWVVEPRLLAFVVAKGRPVACVRLGPAQPIDQAVASWREAVVRGQDPTAPAQELLRRVWTPVRAHLGQADTLLVSPDGALCGLPLAALPGSKPGTFLLDELAIGYLPAARDLLTS